MAVAASAPHRAVVEHMVRQSVYAKLGKPLPRTASGKNPLVVNISARHCHLTQEAVEALFGKGHQLQVHKWLYQEGQFAAKETLTLIGPRSPSFPIFASSALAGISTRSSSHTRMPLRLVLTFRSVCLVTTRRPP